LNPILVAFLFFFTAIPELQSSAVIVADSIVDSRLRCRLLHSLPTLVLQANVVNSDPEKNPIKKLDETASAV
jgi:hypothetical protein